jgi:DNA-binding NarL/FixJ family response regulator
METITRPSQPVRVGLLDFEPLRIAGLREIFAEQPDFQVVATDWAMAFKEPSFDLAVVVLRDQAFTLALLARLRSRHPGLKILVIGPNSEPEKILEAISAGAKGWLEDTASPDQVMQAAYAILSGSIWAPPSWIGLSKAHPHAAAGKIRALPSARKKFCSSWCWRARIARLPRR